MLNQVVMTLGLMHINIPVQNVEKVFLRIKLSFPNAGSITTRTSPLDSYTSQ